jgi:hypothetical protein
MKLKAYTTDKRLLTTDIIFLEEIPQQLSLMMRNANCKLNSAFLKIGNTSIQLHLPTGSCTCSGCKKKRR